MKAIKLDIKDVVRNARAAYNAKELQAQKEHNASTTGIACQYSGPCAIGVSIPEDVRTTLDNTKRWGWRHVD